MLIQSRTATAGTPAFDAAVKDVVARVSREADVRNVRSPLAPGNADQVSKDRHSALVEFDIRGEIDKAPDKVGPVVDAVAAAQAAHPGFFIGEMGDASAPKAVMDQYGKDLGKAGMLSLPITLIILLVTFGALVAAGIPLLLALTAVFGTFGLIAIAEPRAPDGRTRCRRSCSWSGSRSASTTRCSTSGASARNARRAGASGPRSKRPPPPRAGRC